MANNKSLDRKSRQKMIRFAGDQKLKIKTEQRIATALKTNIPPLTKYTLMAGDEVLALSEGERRWILILSIIDIEPEKVLMYTGQRVLKLQIAKVPPKVTAEDDKEMATLHNVTSLFSTGGTSRVLVGKAIKRNDLKGWTQPFDQARTKEINGLLKTRPFKIVIERVITI